MDNNIRLHNNPRNLVRIGVGRRPAVLKVAAALGSALARDADGGAAVGDAVCELVDGARLVAAGEALLVVLAVDGNVLAVAGAELGDGRLDVLHAALGAHLLGGEVGVQARAVPVAGDGLGVDRDLDAEVLGDAVEEEAGQPELVAHWGGSVNEFEGARCAVL